MQRGFTYLWVLVAIAVLGIGLTAASDVWQTTTQRQKLAQLEWAGTQYTLAIGSYVESRPGGGRRYPASMSELLEDRRFAVPRRHLRQLYANPVSSDGQWQVVLGADQLIHGVQSGFPWAPKDPIKEWRYVPATP